MALTEQVVLDIQSAQRTIDQLEQQLAGLGTPINVPVNVSGENELAQIRRELGLSDGAVEDLNRELAQTDDELRNAATQATKTGDNIESAGRRGGSAFAGLRGSVVGFIGAFGAIQGARAFLDFAGDSIQAASDLEESLSKSSVVFGEFAGEIEEFATTGPSALGLSNAAALEFTATFGNLFVALGLSQQAAADLSPEIVQLGADLASFNNIAVDEALTALRSGLVGEVEPLRRLGVSINAAVVEAKALELGLVGANGEVSEAAKVQARYALILEQTATAQGDFARTADGTANSQRSINAELENQRALFGQALLPIYGQLQTAQANLIPIATELAIGLGRLTGAISAADVAAKNFGTDAEGLEDVLGSLLQDSVNPLALFSLVGFLTDITEFALGPTLDELSAGFDDWLGSVDRSEDELRGLREELERQQGQGTITAEEYEVLAGVINDRLVSAANNARDAGRHGARGIEEMADAAGEGVPEIEALASETERAASALRDAGNALLELTNPAFAALAAQERLVEAQAALGEVEIGSPEAVQAALDLAQAEIAVADAAADLPGGLDAASGAILDLIDDGDVATETLQGVEDLLNSLNGTITQAQLDILINTFGSTTGGAFGVGPGFEGVNRGGDGGGGGGGGGTTNNNDITIEIQSTGDTTTDAARAAQQVNAIIN